MLCYDAILAKTGIFKGMSQLFDIKSVGLHWSIIPLTAQALLSPSSCPAVNADLWWRNTGLVGLLGSLGYNWARRVEELCAVSFFATVIKLF